MYNDNMDHENVIIINDKLQIPLAELAFRFATSSGPGGQHVNKAETKVILTFDVANSPSLDEKARSRLLKKLASRLDKDGTLQIQAQDSRSQHQNRELAISRFQKLLAAALKPVKKRHKTKPSRIAIEKRLAEKQQRSRRKQDRSKKWEED